MTKELKCPKCGGIHLVNDDCYNIHLVNDGENNTIREAYCGHCKDCGTYVQWKAIYQFIGYDEIEEDEDY